MFSARADEALEFPQVCPLDFSIGGGYLPDGGRKGAFYLGVDLMTTRWRYLYWTPLHAHFGLQSGCNEEQCGMEGTPLVGTVLGLALHLGEFENHQLALGMGVGLGQVDYGRPGPPMVWWPTIRYTYRFGDRGRGIVGLEIMGLYSGDKTGAVPRALVFSLVMGGQLSWPGFWELLFGR